MFISLEGIDGSGKSTQAKLLADALGDNALLVREPGATPAGERVRELLKDPAIELTPMAELLLFLAARAELCETVIAPALAEGRHVVCDRFSDSTIAYQGHARGLGADRVRELCNAASDGLWPDVTFLVDVDPTLAAKRRSARADDRFEAEGDDFQRAVAAGYEALAGDPRIRRIDGARHAEAIHKEILGIVSGTATSPGAQAEAQA